MDYIDMWSLDYSYDLCWKTSKCLNQLGRGEEVDCPICFQPCHLADRQSSELRKRTMS